VTTAATGELSLPSLGEVELVPFSVGDDPTAEARIGIPVSAETGAAGTVVVLEVDPGKKIPLHTHSAEETLVVLAGSGEATTGDRRSHVSVGSIIVAPASTPHGFENTGFETLRLIGFFGVGVLISSFDEPVAPFGAKSFVVPVVGD
jgi:quercetin dioxygenase-like cupin family protein